MHISLVCLLLSMRITYYALAFRQSFAFIIPRGVIRSFSSSRLSDHQHSFPELNSLQWKQLDLLSECVMDWNQKVNLVSRKDIDEIVPNHVLPALAIAKCCKFASGDSVIDVGTGGGFPGLPLAIVYSNVRFTLLDSSSKKMMVVSDLVRSLKLRNVEVVTSRAEEFNGKYDVIVGRSVSALPNFLSWSAHLLKKGAAQDKGLYYIKGGDFTDELAYAGITQYEKHSISELVPSLPDSDKVVLHIPSDQIIGFSNRKR